MTTPNSATRIRCSYHQERLWFIDKFETANIYPAQPTYHNIPLVLCFRGLVDRSLLEQSINFAVGKHEALRTIVVTEDESPVQVIRESLEIKLRVEEFPQESFNAGNPAHVERILQKSFTPLPLHGEALLSAQLSVFSGETSVLLLTVHHIIADRRSVDILATEILSVYETLRDDGSPKPDGTDLQYVDFSEWQRELNPGDWEPFLLYWKRQLAGTLQALELPTDRARMPIQTYAPAQAQFPVELGLYRKIEGFGKSNGLRTQDVLMGAFILLLHRYSGLGEINIGRMMPNRRQAGTWNVVGPLSNLVALRTQVDATASAAQFFSDMKRVVRDADAYHDLPYEKLVLELAPVPDMSRTALFDVLFTFEQTTVLPETRGLAVEKIENNHGLGKYDLNLLIKEHAASGTGCLVFNTDIYRETSVRRFIRHYTNLLESIVADSATAIHELDIIDAEERELLYHRWNDTDTTYPQAETLVRLFERAVVAWPERIALEQNGSIVLYRELNARANQLARYLIGSHQVEKGGRVGISLEKSPQMIVAVLAILKAGAAYVPIDPAYPLRRVQYILEDTGCPLLLVDREIEPADGLTTVDIRMVDCRRFSDANCEVSLAPDDSAYIIYTSGSTGVPKGCELSHRNVVRLMKNDRHDFDFTEHDIWIMAHSLSFDFSVWEIWGALLYGAELILPDRSRNHDISQMYKLIVEGKVSVLNQTPDSFYLLCALALQDDSHDLASHLRYIVFGGAKLDPTRLKAWIRKYPLDQIRLINMYGITETTVHVTFYALEEKDVLSEHLVSIVGRPLPETKVFILDAHAHLSPVGVWGEIHVGGTGVARGYLNQPELTQMKFVERPALTSERLYSSGDIGRWLDGGVIEYLGRRDSQIKIRGFRIESAEVAFYLKKYTGIQDAVVVSRVNPDAGTGELVVYYTETKNQGACRVTQAGLREHLSGYLPSYMIPSLFVLVPLIPLNASGKVDIQALPAAGLVAAAGSEYVSPHTTIERGITEIWERCLSRQNIGTHDNYFDLGGHSLTAAKIVAEVNRKLSLDMKLSDIFLHPTIAQLAENLSGQLEASQATPVAIPEQDAYRASSSQQRIWIHEQFDARKNIYNVPAAFRLRGDLDIAAINGAFNDLMARHESLRTFFVRKGGHLVQSIVPIRRHEIHVVDYSGEARREELAQAYVHTEAATPFDLSKVPLFRVSLLKMDWHEYLFVFTIHHIISDGWSLNVLQWELSELYQARRANAAHSLVPLPYQYKDFAAWQLRVLDAEPTAHLQSYWRKKLAPPLPSNTLHMVSSAASEQDFRGETLTFSLDTGMAGALRSLAKTKSSSLFMVLLAYVKLLIFKYTAESDIVLGTPAAGRVLPGLEGQIGCYINMLPLRDSIVDTSSFTEILSQVKQTALEAFDHQMYPLESMVDFGAGTNTGANPFFSVAVMMLNHGQGALVLQDIEVTQIPVPKEISLFDLVFEFQERDDAIELNLSYRTALFEKKRMERLWAHFETLVAQGIEKPSDPIRSLTILPPYETELLRSMSAAPLAPHRAVLGSNLVEAFEAVCVKCPNQTVIAADGRSISYAELNRRADTLAHALMTNHGIQTEDVVALLFEPSIEAVTAILGVLKAGAAYVPLDPRWPEKRASFILNDSRSKLLLCGAELCVSARQAVSIPVIGMDETLFLENAPKISRRITPDQLAYIIYTSGSTGQPKGVMIEHRAVLNLVDGLNACIYSAYPAEMQIGCIASLVFDASVQQIFASLLLGHTLHMISDQMKRCPVDLIAMLRTNAVDVLDLTPSLFRMLLRVSAEEDLSPAMKRLIIGGETLSPTLVNAFFANERNQGVVITNVYGPTESTVDALWYDCLPGTNHQTIPVGKPLANTRSYILDINANLVPLGDAGEICIGGTGLARGYTDEHALPTEKFMTAQHLGEERIYRTGDMGRWNRDGNIEFLGRADRQIKLRGHRIELEEIEAKLLQYPDVQAAIVAIVGDDENRNVCAYVVSASKLNQTLLRTHLFEYLPAYMVPSYCIEISSIPLNSSGKVDMAALPSPDLAVSHGQSENESRTETALAAIWAGVLKLEEKSIDRRKTFFELGGNSLTSVYVVSEIMEKLNVGIRLTDFYQHPDIRSLSFFIDQRKHAPSSGIQLTERRLVFELTFQQKRIWIQCERSPADVAYHMPGSIVFDRKPDYDAVRRALYELVKRHDALRLRFVRVNNEIRQRVEYPEEPLLEIVVISGEDDSEGARQRVVTESLLNSFDFDNGPFFRFIVLVAPERYELLYNFHHIIVDGWSLEILKKEFNELYEGMTSNREPKLKPVKYDYSDYIDHHLRILSDSAGIEEASQFWTSQLLRGFPQAHIQTSPMSQENLNSGMGYGCRIDKSLRDSLLVLAKESNTTVPIVMFSAYLQLLRRFYASDQVAAYLIHAGRDYIEFMNTVGVFLNPLLVISRIDNAQTFQQVIRRIHREIQELLHHQAHPMEFVLDRLGVQSYSAPFAFNMLNLPNFSEQAMLSDFRDYRRYDVPAAKFRMELYVVEYLNGIEMFWSFDGRCYDMPMMEYIGNEYVRLIRQLSSNSSPPSVARRTLALPGNFGEVDAQ